MSALAVIQARLGSTRLPGKVLLDLGGRPAIDWVIRAARAIPGIDRVVVATTTAPADDRLVEWLAAAGVDCHRGPEDDVLDRFAGAVRAFPARVVMRITADCPFLDPHLAGQVLALLTVGGCDYASNFDPPSWPDGLDCEAFTAEALFAAAAEARRPTEREHVTPFLRHNRARFAARTVVCDIPALAAERWTLDTPADLDFLRAVASRLPQHDRPPSFPEVLAVLAAEPGLRDLNRAIRRDEGFAKSLAAEPPSLDRPVSLFPVLAHGDGGRVWDTDGHEYIDLAHVPILGHRAPEADAAIRDQLTRGIALGPAPELEQALAQRLGDMIPAAGQALFLAGADGETAALALARHHTGRARVLYCDDEGRPGSLPFNDFDALYTALRPGDVACVVVRWSGLADPAPGFVESVRELTKSHGTLLAFDESAAALRLAPGGAHQFLGVMPDLAWLGGLANGMAMTALIGRGDILAQADPALPRADRLALAAAIAVLGTLRREQVIEHLWRLGEMLEREFSGLTRGLPPALRLDFGDAASGERFRREMQRAGVLVGDTLTLCHAHGEGEIACVLGAYRHALSTLAVA